MADCNTSRNRKPNEEGRDVHGWRKVRETRQSPAWTTSGRNEWRGSLGSLGHYLDVDRSRSDRLTDARCSSATTGFAVRARKRYLAPRD